MSSLLFRLREFRAAQEAVAALEFAIVLPFMLLLYIGGVELGNGLAINVKITEASHTVADLVSQYKTCITDSQVAGILNNVIPKVVAPYPASNGTGNLLFVTVSELTTQSGGTATVTWSQSLNGTPRTIGQAITLPSSLATMPTNVGIIYGEASYAYTPNLGYTISGTVMLYDDYFLYPRQSTFVNLQTSCP
jgi:Flp pilus assembly protein TadG